MSKKECAERIMWDYNCYEVRKVKLSTILRKMYRRGGVWHFNGHAHDYSVPI